MNKQTLRKNAPDTVGFNPVCVSVIQLLAPEHAPLDLDPMMISRDSSPLSWLKLLPGLLMMLLLTQIYWLVLMGVLTVVLALTLFLSRTTHRKLKALQPKVLLRKLLPEEVRAELFVLRRRLKRSNLPRWKVRLRMAGEYAAMYFSLIRVAWDNVILWLKRSMP